MARTCTKYSKTASEQHNCCQSSTRDYRTGANETGNYATTSNSLMEGVKTVGRVSRAYLRGEKIVQKVPKRNKGMHFKKEF